KDGVRHLTHRSRRDASPGRHGGVLPSRSDRGLLRSSLGKNRRKLRGEHALRWPGQPQMVELSIGVPQSEHQPWTLAITRNADHDAIDCPVAFDFYPVTLTRQVPTIPALRHDPLDVRHQPEPV